MKNLVSIIVTTHKGHKESEFAVLSALNQTYKNIEIIVVDDNGLNSEEQLSTAKKLKKYIDKGLIKYIPHSKNINGSAARNTGAQNANGEWLAFLDDDDIYLENKIEAQLNEALKNNFDMVICGGFYVNKKGYGYKSNFKDEDKVILNYLTEKTLFNSSSIFIKKDSFFKLNGFDESFKRHQDWEFCTRAILKFRVGIVKDIHYIKYTFGRNNAQNPEIAEKYLNHFLGKIEKELFEYNNEICQKIKNYQTMRVAKTYYANKDYESFARLMKKTTYRHYYIALFNSNLNHVFKKLFYGLKRRCDSYQKFIDKLLSTRGDFI